MAACPSSGGVLNFIKAGGYIKWGLEQQAFAAVLLATF